MAADRVPPAALSGALLPQYGKKDEHGFPKLTRGGAGAPARRVALGVLRERLAGYGGSYVSTSTLGR